MNSSKRVRELSDGWAENEAIGENTTIRQYKRLSPGSVRTLDSSLKMSAARWTLVVSSSLLLGWILPEFVGARLTNDLRSTKLLVTLTLEIAAVALSMLVSQASARIFALFFWIYVYVFLGLAPLIQIERGRFPLPGSYTTAELDKSAVIVLIGICGYLVGTARGAMGDRRFTVADQISQRIVVPKRVVVLGLLAAPTSLLLLTQIGGVRTLFTSRESVIRSLGFDSMLKYGNNAEGALLMAFTTVPVLLALVLALGYRSRNRSGEGRVWFPGWWILLLASVNVIVNNPIGQPRAWFGSAAIAVLTIFIPLERKRIFTVFAASAILVMVIVFPYADRFRYDSSNPKASVPLSDIFVEKTDHDSFQAFPNSVKFVDENGFTMGRQLLGVATFWIPRSMWSSKPLDTGPVLAQFQGYKLENISAPLWVEGYINFGITGTFGFLYVFGRLSRVLESAWIRSRDSSFASTSLVFPIIAGYQMILLRGSLLQATGRLALLVVLLWCCTRRKAVVDQAEMCPAVEPA